MPAGRPRAHLGREDKVLQAAYRAFATHGFHDTNMGEIAKAGQMGAGAIYRYFGNKLDLFRQVVRYAAWRVAEIVALENPKKSETLTDYEQQLYRIGERLAALVDGEPRLVRFLLQDARGIDPKVDESLDSLLSSFADFTAEYLKHGKRRRYLRADLDVATSARLVNAMILEAVRQLGDGAGTAARHKWMYALIKLMLHGVRMP